MPILGPQIGENCSFRPSNLLGGTYEHPYRRRTVLFQGIPRRVAKFRENRPRDVEKSVDGKFFKIKNNTTKI